MAYEMDGEGVPLVFIHQVATDRRLWYYQRTSFDGRYHLIAVDLFGHGKVAWPRQAFSMEYAARCVQQLLERLGTGPAFVIGVSMGAAVAVRVALDAPPLVQGLVLVSPWSYVDEHLGVLMNRLFRLAEAEGMAAHTNLFLRYLFPPAYAEKHRLKVEWLRALALEQDARAVAYTWAAWPAVDLRRRLGEVRAPSLVIAGMNDLFTPPYLARAVAEKLVEVELEVWEETGHFPFLEDPVRFNHRLEAFILRCLARAGVNDGIGCIREGNRPVTPPPEAL